MGVMKVGNIAPRVGIKLISLPFWVSVPSFTPPLFP